MIVEVCGLDLCDQTGIWHDEDNCDGSGWENGCCAWSFCSCTFGQQKQAEHSMRPAGPTTTRAKLKP